MYAFMHTVIHVCVYFCRACELCVYLCIQLYVFVYNLDAIQTQHTLIVFVCVCVCVCVLGCVCVFIICDYYCILYTCACVPRNAFT